MPRFTSYDGTALAYSTVGQGAPVVCVPGGPGRAVAYLEDLAGLSELRTLVLLDPRATGHSEVPADPATLRFDRMADDLEALRLHLELERLDVLAHSAGTMIAQGWAAQHPSSVGSLVLVTPPGHLQGGDREDTAAIRATFADEPWYAEAVAAREAMEDAPPSQRAGLERMTRAFGYGRWDERAQAHAAGSDTQNSKRALLGFAGDDLDGESLLAKLRDVTAPVLVVGGTRDAITGLDAVQRVAASFPHATVAWVEGAGHYPWVDQPQAFRAAVDPFLA
jgi:pimeloyl-ACP methyl ester carboxylesterase